MIRKTRCECGEVVHVEFTSDQIALTFPSTMECLECGDKRREQEEKRKQRNQKKLISKFAAINE